MGDNFFFNTKYVLLVLSEGKVVKKTPTKWTLQNNFNFLDHPPGMPTSWDIAYLFCLHFIDFLHFKNKFFLNAKKWVYISQLTMNQGTFSRNWKLFIRGHLGGWCLLPNFPPKIFKINMSSIIWIQMKASRMGTQLNVLNNFYPYYWI